MPKGGKSGGDYEGWLLRILKDPENLAYTYTDAEWLDFAGQQIEDYHGLGITGSQAAALEDLRQIARGMQAKIGVSAEIHEALDGDIKIRYRDMAGEFGKKGTYVKPHKVEDKLYAMFGDMAAERRMNRGAL